MQNAGALGGGISGFQPFHYVKLMQQLPEM